MPIVSTIRHGCSVLRSICSSSPCLLRPQQSHSGTVMRTRCEAAALLSSAFHRELLLLWSLCSRSVRACTNSLLLLDCCSGYECWPVALLYGTPARNLYVATTGMLDAVGQMSRVDVKSITEEKEKKKRTEYPGLSMGGHLSYNSINSR